MTMCVHVRTHVELCPSLHAVRCVFYKNAYESLCPSEWVSAMGRGCLLLGWLKKAVLGVDPMAGAQLRVMPGLHAVRRPLLAQPCPCLTPSLSLVT